VPCHILSRQSAPRQPVAEGLGGSLKMWALEILRRRRSITTSSAILEEAGGICVVVGLLYLRELYAPIRFSEKLPSNL